MLKHRPFLQALGQSVIDQHQPGPPLQPDTLLELGEIFWRIIREDITGITQIQLSSNTMEDIAISRLRPPVDAGNLALAALNDEQEVAAITECARLQALRLSERSAEPAAIAKRSQTYQQQLRLLSIQDLEEKRQAGFEIIASPLELENCQDSEQLERMIANRTHNHVRKIFTKLLPTEIGAFRLSHNLEFISQDVARMHQILLLTATYATACSDPTLVARAPELCDLLRRARGLELGQQVEVFDQLIRIQQKCFAAFKEKDEQEMAKVTLAFREASARNTPVDEAYEDLLAAVVKANLVNEAGKGKTGRTALHWAAIVGCIEKINRIMDAGGDPTQEDNARKTAVQLFKRPQGMSDQDCARLFAPRRPPVVPAQAMPAAAPQPVQSAADYLQPPPLSVTESLLLNLFAPPRPAQGSAEGASTASGSEHYTQFVISN